MSEGPPISYESWAKAVETMNRYREALEKVRHLASYHTGRDEQISAIFDVAHAVLGGTRDHVCCFERHEDGDCYSCIECDAEYVCPRLSLFMLRRDPNDGSYQAEEACEGHVADSMALLYDGDPSARVVVEMHWEGDAQPACENTTPLAHEAVVNDGPEPSEPTPIWPDSDA